MRRLAPLLLVAGVALSCRSDALDPDRPDVSSVVVSPSRLTVGVGGTASLTVEARDGAGTILRDRKVHWASSDPTRATVSATGVVTGVAPGEVQVAATVEGKSAIVDVVVNPKAVATVRLSPAGDQHLLVGQTRKFVAEPLDAGGAPLSDRAIAWSSNTPAVATVAPDGLVTAVAPGGAVISATSEGRSAVVAVTVSSIPVASVEVTPGTDTIVVGQTAQLTATLRDAQGAPLPGRPIAWSTSEAAIATVSSTGLVTGVAPGTVTITAASEGKSAPATVVVRPKPVGAVIVSPAQVSVEAGKTTQLTAQVTDAEGNVLSGRPVTFSSENLSVASVSANGTVTGVTPGKVKITATSEGKTGTADVTVVSVPVATVQITPPQTDLTVGQSATLTATTRDAAGNVLTGRSVTWTSSNNNVATVSASGEVTATGVGAVVIFATVEGRTGTATVNVRQVPVASVTVTPPDAVVAVNGSVQLSAAVRSADGAVLNDRVVGWTSSNETIAIVSSTGRVTGLRQGVVTVTATSEGVSGTSAITVGVASITISPSSATVTVATTRQLAATARDAQGNVVGGLTFSWSSSAPLVASVSQTGLVTGLAPGSATITAAVGSVTGTSAITVQLVPVNSVTISPVFTSVEVGKTVALTATLRDAANNILTGRTVTWTSSNTSRATVDGSGVVTGRSTGNVTITATSEGKSGQSTVSVR